MKLEKEIIEKKYEKLDISKVINRQQAQSTLLSKPK